MILVVVGASVLPLLRRLDLPMTASGAAGAGYEFGFGLDPDLGCHWDSCLESKIKPQIITCKK